MSCWVVDIRDYLDPNTGDLPDDISAQATNLALFLGSIVEWVTDHQPRGNGMTNVPCRRSPGRRRCRGSILADLEKQTGQIIWRCSDCRDNGLIQGWRLTPWDRVDYVRLLSDRVAKESVH